MITRSIIEQGEVFYPSRRALVNEFDWNAHSTFKGVYLKHLVKGADTDGKFSCHLVRVEAGCQIGSHIHEGKWKLHEVLEGTGECFLDHDKVTYQEGVTTVIPEGLNHSVIAEKELYLLAKFIPALL